MRFKKGNVPWHKGRTGVYSKESLKKMSEARTGKKMSEETKKKVGLNSARYWLGKSLPKKTREKISKSSLGKKMSKETKRKLSENHSGKNHPNWGKCRSEETRAKISKAHTGMKKTWAGKCPRSKETREKISRVQKGKKLSEETKRKMSEARKGKYPRSYYQKIGAMSVQKQSKAKGPTSIEKKVYEELKRRGLLFEKQKLIKGKFVVDAYIPSLNLVIEADGDYWHSLPEAIWRDKSRDAYLKACGFSLLRLTETEINNGGFLDKLPTKN